VTFFLLNFFKLFVFRNFNYERKKVLVEESGEDSCEEEKLGGLTNVNLEMSGVYWVRIRRGG